MRSKVVAITALVILLIVNWSIMRKEQHLSGGSIIFLELAPIDPRSLMQGDYMALRFVIANDILMALKQNSIDMDLAYDGKVVVLLDENRVGRFGRLADGVIDGGNEISLRYRIRDGRVKFASNAFFFQEGNAEKYSSASYGQFRINESGELLLADLYDKELNSLSEQ